MFVKICGCKSVADVLTAREAGADAFGVIESQVKDPDLLIQAESALASVIVSESTNLQHLKKLLRQTRAHFIQVRREIGDQALIQLAKEAQVIAVVGVRGPEAVEDALTAPPQVAMILLDSPKSGSGVTHDWSVSSQIVAESDHPVVLAGGLSADNVSDAIRVVSPTGVDASSRLRDQSGAKDLWLCEEFVRAAKNPCRA